MGNLLVMQCNVILIILGLGIKYSQCLWPPSYKVNLNDKQTFVISSDEDYDEYENEIIQPQDLVGIESLVEDEAKYEPLHLHVEKYNQRAAEKAEKLSQSFPFHPVIESGFKEEPKPFIAGFKHKLDKKSDHSLKKRSPSEDKTVKSPFRKLFSAMSANKNAGYVHNNHERIKRSDEDDPLDSTDFFEDLSNRNPTTEDITEDQTIVEYLEETNLPEATEETNSDQFLENRSPETGAPEDYDYDKLKEEYDQQIQEIQKRNETFNYTDLGGEPEETVKDAVKKILDFKMPKNCTKEELSQIGAKAFECLIYDYQHAKNKTDVKKVLNRTWMVLKIWVFIYICIAIPCWCQKGWCCCCFCCEICFPKEIIQAEKKYFAENPPGTLVKREKVHGRVKTETVEYKPTLFEYDAYEQLESAIRNI